MGILPDWLRFEISIKQPPSLLSIGFGNEPGSIQVITVETVEEDNDGTDTNI